MTNEKPAEYLRFNVIFRLQHIILFVTFFLLAFTGWALKYTDPMLEHAGWWIKLWGGGKTAGLIHKVAGVTMVLDFVWHVLYIFYLLGTGKMKFDTRTTVVPLPKDVADAVQNFLYFFGVSDEKPQYGRYTYLQKFDYWAVFWGMGIIGLSGLFLTFPTKAQHLFPDFSLNWIWELVSVLHSDEALLAIVFILFIHFYNEHLKIENFPMNTSWITGKISMEKFKHEHPIEYELEMSENPSLTETEKNRQGER